MSAPAGLAVSKIIYPEVEEPETRDLSKMQHQEDRLYYKSLSLHCHVFLLRFWFKNAVFKN